MKILVRQLLLGVVFMTPIKAAVLLIEGQFSASYRTNIDTLTISFSATVEEQLVHSFENSQELPLTFTALTVSPQVLGTTPLTSNTVGINGRFKDGELTTVIIGIINSGATQRGLGSVASNKDDFFTIINTIPNAPLSSAASVAAIPGVGDLAGGQGYVSIVPEPSTCCMIALFSVLFLKRNRKFDS